MEEILGLTPTGRELRDPAARLLEAVDAEGRHYTVLAFEEAHLGHAALTLNVELVLSFMEFPMVTGLVGLARHDLELGQFAFGTGSVWTLAEVARAFGDFGHVVGLRAGLELAWLAAQVLVEAGETGPMQGCFSHGNVSPTRLALRADGQVQVFGHGLAQVEVMRHREAGYPLEPSSLRYCPPERLEGVPEDAAADTYALTLVVYELITGKPLLDTNDIDELTRMVGMSEGATVLSRSNAGLPPKVAKVLARSLIYDPDTRLSGQDYVDAIGGLLANEVLDGPSLSEIVEKLQGLGSKAIRRGRKLVAAKSTTAFTPEMLAQLAEDDDDDDDDDDAAPRWSKVSRPRRGSPDDKPAPEEPTKRSRRRKPAPEAAPAEATEGSSRRRRRRAPEEPAPDTAAEGSTSRRRRRSPAPEPEAKSEPTGNAEPAAEASPPKRSRRRKPDAGAVAAEAAAKEADVVKEAKEAKEATEASRSTRRRRKPPTAEEQEAPPSTSRRRRRAPPDDDDEAAPAPKRRRGPGDDDDDDEPPRRRRRAPAGDDDDVDEAPPRRRRRPAKEDAEAEEAPSKPRRRRRPPKA